MLLTSHRRVGGLKDIVIDEIASGRGETRVIISTAAGLMFVAGASLAIIFTGVSALILFVSWITILDGSHPVHHSSRERFRSAFFWSGSTRKASDGSNRPASFHSRKCCSQGGIAYCWRQRHFLRGNYIP